MIPQRSEDYEFGVRHYFIENLYTDINFFRIDTANEIFYNLTSFANENLDGTTRRDGVEISFNAKATEWISFNGSYAYLDATIEGGQFAGSRLPGVAKRKATFGILLS